MRDHRDLALMEFADSERALRALVASLEADKAAYRLLAQEAIHALHNLTAKHEQQRAQYRAVLDELRALRTERRAA